VIIGDTNLPDQLKIGAEIHIHKWPPDRDLEIVVDQGHFRSRGFVSRQLPYPPGQYRVHFLAYFNGEWQKPRLLGLAGDGGTQLKPGPLFKLQDANLIDSDKILDFWRTITFPPLSGEAQAIYLVKNAVLTTSERGRSAATVERTINEFMKPPSVQPARGWSAAKIQSEEYRVF